MKQLLSLVITAMALLALPKTSLAVPIQGDPVIATGGEVIARFLGFDASFSNDLFFCGTSTACSGGGTFLFNNQTTPIGATTSLGTFSPGTELVFRLLVHAQGDHSYFTGSGITNPDNVAHATVDTTSGNIGFEDLFGGGDLDFNDLRYNLTNISNPRETITNPEPASLLLLGSGLVALVVAIKKRRARL